MTSESKPTLPYAHGGFDKLPRPWNVFHAASLVIGALVILANVAIFIGAWGDYRFNVNTYGPTPRMVAGWRIQIADAAVSVLAGGYLLYAARVLRRDLTAGLRHHRIYAIVKLLLATAAAVGGLLLEGQGDAALLGGLLTLLVILQFAISAAYPLVIIHYLLQRWSDQREWDD